MPFFFFFTILHWFCHIATWIHHEHTHVPHPELPPTSLPIPSLQVIPVPRPQASCIEPALAFLWKLLGETVLAYECLTTFYCKWFKENAVSETGILTVCSLWPTETAKPVPITYADGKANAVFYILISLVVICYRDDRNICIIQI